jgi:GTP-binding protein
VVRRRKTGRFYNAPPRAPSPVGLSPCLLLPARARHPRAPRRLPRIPPSGRWAGCTRPASSPRPRSWSIPAAARLPEIAFVGRSNAGKSTCINTLTQQKRLAFASKTPGRTQSINLFSLGKQGITDAVLADLPGYGYAAVPKQDKLRWQRVMANYLVTRENLRGVVLMCDPRHGLTELDDILLEVIRPRVEQGLKFLILLTKADKLNRSEATKVLSIAKLQAGRRRGQAVLGPQAPGRRRAA